MLARECGGKVELPTRALYSGCQIEPTRRKLDLAAAFAR